MSGRIDAYALSSLFPIFPCQGKIPSVKNWQNTQINPLFLPGDIAGNYGLNLLSDKIVIDVDPRNFKDGADSLALLENDINQTLIGCKTFVVKTPGGGWHYYFKKNPEIPVLKKLSRYPGIDVLSSGCYVLGPGSTNPENGREYTVWSGDPTDLADVPERLLLLFQKPVTKIEELRDIKFDGPANTERFRRFLSDRAPAVSGDNGDQWTLKTAYIGRDMGLSQEETYEIMAVWNEKCSPPWGPEELWVKVENAYRYGKNYAGAMVAEFEPVEEVADSAVYEWDRNKDLSYKPTIQNIVRLFEYPKITLPPHGTEEHNPLCGLIIYNAFTEKIGFVKPAPWHTFEYAPKNWNDGDFLLFKAWMSQSMRLNFTTELIREGVFVAAQKRRFHPVKDYFEKLTWDGKPRLEYLFSHYTDSEDTAYSREVSKRTLIGAVARVMQPGCKFDTVVVLEGDQGIGKSTFCAVLGGEFYADIHLDPKNKDVISYMKGKMIIEISEFVGVTQGDVSQLKFFLARSTDIVRKAYDRLEGDYPRQSIFIGTINPQAGNTYLRDTTGNRRFWPISCGGNIKLEDLKRDRDQLFAEALHLYYAGEKWFIQDLEANQIAKEKQLDRLKEDPWSDRITEWLSQQERAGMKHEQLSSIFLCQHVLFIRLESINPAVYQRLANSMADLGWIRDKWKEDGVQIRGFKKAKDPLKLGGIFDLEGL